MDERKIKEVLKSLCFAGIMFISFQIILLIAGYFLNIRSKIYINSLINIISALFFSIYSIILFNNSKIKDKISKDNSDIDERELYIGNKIMGIGFIFLITINFISLIYGIFTKKYINLDIFILLNLLLFSVFIMIYKNKVKYFSIPRKNNEYLALDMDIKSTFIRIKYYLRDSIVISIILILLEIRNKNSLFSNINNKLINYILGFLSYTMIITIFNLVYGEYNISRYKKEMDKLE